jgi:hypothetical protein
VVNDGKSRVYLVALDQAPARSASTTSFRDEGATVPGVSFTRGPLAARRYGECGAARVSVLEAVALCHPERQRGIFSDVPVARPATMTFTRDPSLMLSVALEMTTTELREQQDRMARIGRIEKMASALESVSRGPNEWEHISGE